MKDTMKKKLRGYLLAEAMVSGAILATSIGITFALIAQAKSGQIYAAHRARATDLARTKIEELATATVCTAAGPTSFSSTVYTGSFTVADAGGTSVPAIPAGKLCSAIVTVDYPAGTNSAEDLTDGTMGNAKGRVRFTKMWGL